jgi:aryl-alcohol dehydrogenase-like predicted oxidoreductase
MSQALDLGLMAWSPLGMGLLTGKYATDSPEARDGRLSRDATAGAHMLTDRNLEIARVVAEVGAELDASSSQVALACYGAARGWCCRSWLRDNLGALELGLTSDQLDRLDAVSAIDLGFPHEFIRQQRQGTFVLGDAHDRIEDHRAPRSGLARARE